MLSFPVRSANIRSQKAKGGATAENSSRSRSGLFSLAIECHSNFVREAHTEKESSLPLVGHVGHSSFDSYSEPSTT
ncbi:hypothetical protein Hdeb2414_s0002g00053081 [Helianthus debilis subsp. tardiflorus]